MEKTAEIVDQKSSASSDVWRWIGYSLLIGIVPILFSIFFTVGKKHFDLSEFLYNGELLYVSFALAGERVGDLYHHNHNKPKAFYACLFALISSALGFAGISQIDKTLFTVYSMIVFGLTVFAGISSKWERKQSDIARNIHLCFLGLWACERNYQCFADFGLSKKTKVEIGWVL